MGYKLHLKPRNGMQPEQFEAYLSSRTNYTRDQNNFNYTNKNTGVYFTVTADNQDHILFSMNINLPSFFAFEAEEELRHITRDLDLIVIDPEQNSAHDYDGERFLREWRNRTNHASEAFKQMQESNERSIQLYTLEQKDLHKMWSWNKNRKLYQEHLGNSFYVPPIWPVKISNTVSTATMWPNGIPTFIPQANFIIIARDKVSQEQATEKKPDISVIPWNQAFQIIEKYSEKIQEDGFLVNSYTEVPEEVKQFISQLPSSGKVERISFDNILDRELWVQENADI